MPPPQPMTVESGRFPGVTIECGGDPGLTEDECQAWAEQLLASGPSETTKLVLTYPTGNSRCAADHFSANGRMLMTAAARCPAP
ncbi:MAG: hypothetical protein KY392_04005 [Chloroflexi bacterium]|nr:hypothetical protein [Chloroflexota bacterium]